MTHGGALTAVVGFTLAYVITYHLLIHNALKLRKKAVSDAGSWLATLTYLSDTRRCEIIQS